jgi:DNA-binding transcriptional regulator YhcF (GntR family)
MSLTAMVWALKQKVGNPAAKLVLLKIADNANDRGLAWPSISTIAEICEIDKTTVRRHLKRLEELNLVGVIHRRAEEINLSNHYQLNFSENSEKIGRCNLHPVVAKNTGGGRNLHLGVGAKCTPNHPIEPVIKPSLHPTTKNDESANSNSEAGEIDFTNLTQIRRLILKSKSLSNAITSQPLADALEVSIRQGLDSGNKVKFPQKIVSFLNKLSQVELDEWGEPVKRERERNKQLSAAQLSIEFSHVAKPDQIARQAGERLMQKVRNDRQLNK